MKGGGGTGAAPPTGQHMHVGQQDHVKAKNGYYMNIIDGKSHKYYLSSVA